MDEPEIETRLRRDLPRWRLEGGMLHRRYRTADFRSALLVANAIGHLAEAAFHHPDLTIGYGRVDVALVTHSERAVTEKDFELAARIEATVGWDPAQETGALEGPPAGKPHLAHERHDREIRKKG